MNSLDTNPPTMTSPVTLMACLSLLSLSLQSVRASRARPRAAGSCVTPTPSSCSWGTSRTMWTRRNSRSSLSVSSSSSPSSPFSSNSFLFSSSFTSSLSSFTSFSLFFFIFFFFSLINHNKPSSRGVTPPPQSTVRSWSSGSTAEGSSLTLASWCLTTPSRSRRSSAAG